MSISTSGANFDNLSQSEKQAVKDLQSDESIVIKAADKGSAVVVWERADYMKEAESQLSDEQVYERCPTDPLPILQRLITTTLRQIERTGEIGANTLKFLEKSDENLCRFFLLPKIHKRLFNVPGRPIISNCGYLTEHISEFLDYHLQPLAKNVKSYIKDTNDFLKKIRDMPDLSENSILCSIDVTGLYPNIPHNEGLDAMRKALENRGDHSVSTDTLLELADLVLKNNFFEFDGKTYRQKQGTAMGTKFAPSYAIIFMAEFEEFALSNLEYAPCIWWRYIDDVFFVWEHGEEKLEEFMLYLNSVHPTIKFTGKHSPHTIEFLDVLVTRVGNRLKTDLFVKETDTHQYLQFSSCHPWHTKKGIPYSQALRMRRICSEDDDFHKRCEDLHGWLLNRGFNNRMVTDQIERAKNSDRNSLLDVENEQARDNKVNFVVTYHPALNRKLIEILRSNHFLLQRDPDHASCFNDVPRVAFRRPKNLKDRLVSAKLPIHDMSEMGCFSDCRDCRSDCTTGAYLETTNTFRAKLNPIPYEIRRGPLRCNSHLVIYLLTCKKCGIQYVGKSKPPFRLRFNNYRSHFRAFLKAKNESGTTKSSVSQAKLFEHFTQRDHNGMEDWSFVLIDQAHSDDQLVKKELFWQYQLNVFAPHGLNIRNAPAF